MIQGKGLGLRREFLQQLAQSPIEDLDFLELAPENWIGVGGRRKALLQQVAAHYPLVAHGLCLSLGSPAPLDFGFLRDLKQFLEQYQIETYSDHLSFSSDEGQLYDLMPIPFSEESVLYVAERIRQVQDFLERPIAVENISYYADVSLSLNESDFINAVLREADCKLLLDVNNVFVNSVNHSYDPRAFIDSLPGECIAYIHIAGHERIQPQLIIDTHGSDVIDPVWELLQYTYRTHGIKPTLLERDSNIPPLEELMEEVALIHELQMEFEYE